MADLEEANLEVHDYFNGEPPTDIARASLIGLVLVAREIGGQLDQIDNRLAKIAEALENLVAAANRAGLQ